MAQKAFVDRGPSVARDPSSSRPRWPTSQLPVELFTLIISFISRADIQNMRLVCREFEEKVSPTLFKTVVVPFNPEIYGIKEEPLPDPLSNVPPKRRSEPYDAQDDRIRCGGGVMLQDKGMRVFRGFGKHILRFAMSFEVDPTTLLNPPLKNDQEAITTFWGIYRWPFKTYNRYSHLEGLEQTADETRTMADALQCVSKATELGLSIDCGLGWLTGPDTNPYVSTQRKPPVFGEARSTEVPKMKGGARNIPVGIFADDQTSNELLNFQRMLREAGYEGEELERSLTTLLATEGLPPRPSSHPNLPVPIPATTGGEPVDRRRELAESMLRTFGYSFTAIEAMRSFLANQDTILPAVESTENEEPEPSREPIITAIKLKPNDLTTAQKEMLLEIEWAQRAFMHSYVIAIIDNQATFRFVQKLTVSRLPSRYLSILQREDFWDSLPEVSTLSLAVIPDWRDVSKLASSFVQDAKVAPSRAVEAVFTVLKNYIAHRKRIKSLHFEWLCGGEEAVGLFARNQHVLPLPIVPKSSDMVSSTKGDCILSFAHVEHLSLKNCWSNPYVFTQFVNSLKRNSLRTLTLFSVSLTDVPSDPPVLDSSVPTHLGPQSPGSWPYVINLITPGKTLEAMRYEQGIGPKPQRRKPQKLRKILFDSCGYVNLPPDFEHRHLPINNDPSPEANLLAKRRADIEAFMMKPHDQALGTVLNHIPPHEANTLVNAWLLQMGWNASWTSLVTQAHHDGISTPGEGRFRGTLEALDSDAERRSSDY